MRRGGTVAIMFGLPSPLAHDDNQNDEEHLNRERGDNGGDDPAAEMVERIAQSLSDRGPGACRRVRQLAAALEAMAEACMQRDSAGLNDAADDAHQELTKIFAG